MSGEFRPLDSGVLVLAAVFNREHFRWTVRDGEAVTPYVPDAVDIAKALDRLHETAMWQRASHHKECETCENGDGYYCGERPRSGRAESGRLFVDWSEDGYGPEVSFGLTFKRLPELFR